MKTPSSQSPKGDAIPDYVEQFMHREEEQKEHHLPFHHYAGPGTHVISNLMKDVKPTTYLDEVSRQHDIDYLKPNNQQKADNIMVKKLLKHYWYMPQIGAVTKVAFVLKDFLGLKDNDETDERIYEYANKLLKNSKY
jgi:hypothetical protein